MTWSASHTSSRSREPVTVRMGGEGRIEANDAAPRSIGEPRRYRGGAARPGRSPRRLPPYGSRRGACTPRTGPVRGLTADAPRGLVDGSSRLRPISSLIKKESPARIDSEEAAIGRPTQTAPPGRGLGQPQRPTGLRQRAPAARRLARRPRARRRGPRGVRCRTARRRACFLERLDGGRRGVVPREAQRPADPGRREDRPGAGRLPADRRRSGAPAGAAVRGLGSCGRAFATCHPAAAARARRRVRGGHPRTRPSRCGGRRIALHGRDAAQPPARHARMSSGSNQGLALQHDLRRITGGQHAKDMLDGETAVPDGTVDHRLLAGPFASRRRRACRSAEALFHNTRALALPDQRQDPGPGTASGLSSRNAVHAAGRFRRACGCDSATERQT